MGTFREVKVGAGSGLDVVTHDVSPTGSGCRGQDEGGLHHRAGLDPGQQENRSLPSLDETINRYKQSRDVSTLNSGKKSLETEHKALTSEIASLQSRLKTEGSDLCDKVSVCHPRVTQLSALLVTPLGIVLHILEHHGAAVCGSHAGQLLLCLVLWC